MDISKFTVTSAAVVALMLGTPLATAQTAEEPAAEEAEMPADDAAVETTTETVPIETEEADTEAADTDMEATEPADTEAATDTEAPADTEAETDVEVAEPAETEAADTDMTATEPAEADMTAETPAVDGVVSTDIADPDMTEGDAEMEVVEEEPAQPVEGQITQQDSDTMLAGELIGSTVYNANDEAVGDIDNLIISMDGTVQGVVIGVGGFLGLGERMIAVELSSLEVMQDENGDPRMMTSATRADMEAAEEFITAEQQQRAEDAATMQQETEATVDGTAPAPAD